MTCDSAIAVSISVHLINNYTLEFRIHHSNTTGRLAATPPRNMCLRRVLALTFTPEHSSHEHLNSNDDVLVTSILMRISILSADLVVARLWPVKFKND